jgi:hypothetical protein
MNHRSHHDAICFIGSAVPDRPRGQRAAPVAHSFVEDPCSCVPKANANRPRRIGKILYCKYFVEYVANALNNTLQQ